VGRDQSEAQARQEFKVLSEQLAQLAFKEISVLQACAEAQVQVQQELLEPRGLEAPERLAQQVREQQAQLD
jgi:hypothetical protein